MTTVFVPMRTARGLNSREHFFQRYARNRKEKEAAGWFLKQLHHRPALPVTILLTRVAPSNGLDNDNLQGALKGVRDAVADWIHVDDKHAHIVRYEYAQERGPEWAVRISWPGSEAP